MGSRRHGERINSFEKCVLNHNGRSIQCYLEDISISGVLVNCYDVSMENIRLGDVCTIDLADDPKITHREVKCSVTRFTTTQIGLQFTY
ncbi:PilZ domain-containing protein [Geobacter sp. SVR]|uniref:PilZ domain-containing protein n=1 Tax=Geobacter sp. SVR TaxID=2495594 RepID=UPI00143EFB18|nr:PilZ domain-containing protein [Geobacter sp. SVR]BCS54217.1 hypothetical protein GSVR_25250 [Geobacter sp. SVR]GCF85925.1 hypothetical protein GSbR_25250 [Geobacter sp. SVR]